MASVLLNVKEHFRLNAKQSTFRERYARMELEAGFKFTKLTQMQEEAKIRSNDTIKILSLVNIAITTAHMTPEQTAAFSNEIMQFFGADDGSFNLPVGYMTAGGITVSAALAASFTVAHRIGGSS